jgi:PKD repeat protein
VNTASLGTARLLLSGQSIDLSGSATDPAGGSLGYSWDYAGAAGATPADVADPPAFAVNSALGFTLYPITLTVRSSVNGATGTAALPLYAKQPPTAVLSFASPGTSPDPYGEAPLAADVGATVFANDPFLEGVEDTDANGTDYTFEWTFESGATDTTHITGASHTYTTTGAKTVSLRLTDDYGYSGTVAQAVYATPLDRINFPPTQQLPFEPVAAIDGVLRPTDTDGNGSIDVVETGWNRAFRATHANGTNDPAALQCLRFQKSPTEAYLLLSFEVNGDVIYDDNDAIVLTFRPDRMAGLPADDRRIFLFPVWNDAGACDAGGTGGSLTQHRLSKPPRLIQYFQDSAGWAPIGTGITEAASEADPGFFARVHSFPAGSTYSWEVELRIPIERTTGGAGWIDITGDFLFYANLIRVTDRSASFGEAGYAMQSRWPREAPPASGTLTGYAFPAYTWGTASRVSSLGDSKGLYLESYADVGILSGSSIVGNVSLSPGNNTIPFIARVRNNSEAPLGDVNVLFRYAHWGATLGVGGDWREVPAPDSSACPADQSSEPSSYDHNRTCSLQVPSASGATPGSRDFRLDWELASTDPEYIYFRDVQDHQCVYAEIDAAAGANILRKSTWRNVNFMASSVVSDTAGISTVGCGLPHGAGGKHRVLLEVKKREWSSASAATAREPLDRPGTKRISSFMEYLVYAYYDNGQALTIGEQKYYLFEPIASFGYVFHHPDEVFGWLDSIAGARRIREDLYVIDIAPDGKEDVALRVRSVEPTGFSLSLHAGAATPLANFSSTLATGFNVGLDVGYEVSPLLSLILFAGYSHLPGASSSVAATSILNVGLNARATVRLRGNLYAYAQAGPNLYLQDFSAVDWGYNGGLGLGILLCPRFRLEAGADYHSTFSQQNWLLQSRAGVVLRL